MKRKHFILLVLGLGFVVASIFGILWIKRFIQIDACIDKGGKWNYELDICEKYPRIDSVRISDFYWHAAYDTIRNIEVLVKGKMIDSIGQSTNELIEILNRRKPECKLEYIDKVEDTVIIRILNDEFLGERMGTTGAYCYLGETVFTLTENKSISFVRIEMNYGSHASPGIYNRNNFKDLVGYK